MDKYEFNIKAEQMRKMAEQGDYKTAMQIADTIDWRRVRNANLLSYVADIYEHNSEYEEAKDILLLAFERAPVGKRFLYKLAEISVKAGDLQDAQEFYHEFCEMSPDDSRQFLLRYLILKGPALSSSSHRSRSIPLWKWTRSGSIPSRSFTVKQAARMRASAPVIKSCFSSVSDSMWIRPWS